MKSRVPKGIRFFFAFHEYSIISLPWQVFCYSSLISANRSKWGAFDKKFRGHISIFTAMGKYHEEKPRSPTKNELVNYIGPIFEELKTDIRDVKGNIRELKTDVSGLKTDVSELKTDVSELKTDVSELKTDVSELKTDVSELKTDVIGLKTDVSGLKTDVSELKTDVSELKTDVSGLKTDVSELKTDVTSIKTDILRLDKKMDTKVDFSQLEAVRSELIDKINWQGTIMDQMNKKIDLALESTGRIHSHDTILKEHSGKIETLERNVKVLIDISKR